MIPDATIVRWLFLKSRPGVLLPYHSITEIATIATGLVVHFSDGGQVQILGSLLGPLFEALAENKCVAVRIGGEQGKMQISAIAVLSGDE